MKVALPILPKRRSSFSVILALAIGGFSASSRVIRSAVLQVKENEYVMAAKAIGCRDFFIIFRHILPNVAAPVSNNEKGTKNNYGGSLL